MRLNYRWFLVGLILAAAGGCGPNVPPDLLPDMNAVGDIRAQLGSGQASTSAGTPAAPAASPEGFATLRGKFTLDGAAPDPVILDISKDQAICMPGGKPVADRAVQVAADGGLANVLIYADGVPDAWVHESAHGKTDEVEFDQKQCEFLSRVTAIETTQKLKILNSDPVGHNTKMEPSRNVPLNQNIPANGSVIYPATSGELSEEKRPFAVQCSVHPWMLSYLIIRKNGYFAVTRPDGSFEIPNLPAGVPVTFTVWHERPGFLADTAVQVSGDTGVVSGWSKRGVVTVTLKPDTTADLQIAVKSAAFSK
jgi:hypothetical protein